MPCSKFISIRLEPGVETRIYVDKMTAPHRTMNALPQFTLQSPYVDQTNEGTAVSVEPLRWPPEGYDAAMLMTLSAQWPFKTDCYEANDTAGASNGRSFPALAFVYDEAGRKLSWGQNSAATPGAMQASVKFNDRTPVWYVTLRLNPAAPKSRGQLMINGADIS